MYKNYIQHYAAMLQPANDVAHHERAFERRSQDLCILVIDGQSYPVHDWSSGGILFEAPESRFALGKPHRLTMKFKLNDRIIDINHSGHVVRKSQFKVAIQFDPLSADVRKSFNTIMRYRSLIDKESRDTVL
jgi:hypothetical protein